MKRWKASYTVEASFIIPLCIWVMACAMRIGIDCYVEIQNEKEQDRVKDLWQVEQFYKFQWLKEAGNDQS